MLTTKQTEDLFDAAMRVSNLATQAGQFRHVTFPADLDKALDALSLLLQKLEPFVKGRESAIAIITQVMERLGPGLDTEYLRMAKKSLEPESE